MLVASSVEPVAGARPDADAFRRGRSPTGQTASARRSRCSCAPTEINYDYSNERVSAVGNVQIYYRRLDARSRPGDLRSEDQAPACGRQCRADRGRRQGHPRRDHGSERRLSATASSICCGSTPPSRPASPPRAPSAPSGNFTVFQNGVYTACEPCKDDPKKPPKWQVKAARIIHDQGEKMMYFEDARLEFFGVPLAYLPYFSAPDPTVKRKTGLLMPTFSTELGLRLRRHGPVLLGAGARLRRDLHADDHDQAGPAAAGRVAPAAAQRRLHASAPPASSSSTRACSSTTATPGYPRLARQHRNVGPVQSLGQMGLGLGRHAAHGQDLSPGLRPAQKRPDRQSAQIDARTTRSSQALPRRAAATAATSTRARCTSTASRRRRRSRSQIPVVHPVIDHDYVVQQSGLRRRARASTTT